jgi:hypothetical protein
LVGTLILASCAEAPSTRPLVAGPIQPSPKARASAGRTIELSAADVFGVPVRVGTADHSPVTVVFFMSRESRDESAELARGVDEGLLDAPVEQVGIVDVHRYGGITRSFALGRMRKSVEEARASRRQRRLEHHADASPAAVNRWHLIGDFDGALFRQLGVELDLEHPVAFVVEAGGRLHGPYHDVGDVVAEVVRVIRGAADKRARKAPARGAARHRSVSP